MYLLYKTSLENWWINQGYSYYTKCLSTWNFPWSALKKERFGATLELRENWTLVKSSYKTLSFTFNTHIRVLISKYCMSLVTTHIHLAWYDPKDRDCGSMLPLREIQWTIFIFYQGFVINESYNEDLLGLL